MDYSKLAGYFEKLHENPPPAFNPDYNPNAKSAWGVVIKSMEDDGFYSNHTREECASEFKRRYEAAMADQRN